MPSISQNNIPDYDGGVYKPNEYVDVNANSESINKISKLSPKILVIKETDFSKDEDLIDSIVGCRDAYMLKFANCKMSKEEYLILTKLRNTVIFKNCIVVDKETNARKIIPKAGFLNQGHKSLPIDPDEWEKRGLLSGAVLKELQDLDRVTSEMTTVSADYADPMQIKKEIEKANGLIEEAEKLYLYREQLTRSPELQASKGEYLKLFSVFSEATSKMSDTVNELKELINSTLKEQSESAFLNSIKDKNDLLQKQIKKCAEARDGCLFY